MSDEEEPTFETELVLNAFYSLMPTANRISQFLMLAEGQDFETMREAYPELLGDKKTRDKFLKILGYEIENGKIKEQYGFYEYLGGTTKEGISRFFEILGKRSGVKTVIVNGEKTENYHHKRNHRHLDTHIRPKSKKLRFRNIHYSSSSSSPIFMVFKLIGYNFTRNCFLYDILLRIALSVSFKFHWHPFRLLFPLPFLHCEN